MNCMKSVRFIRDYGTIRLVMLSVFHMLIFFSLSYILLDHLHPKLHLGATNPLILLGVMLAAYPAHKLGHLLPVWLSGHRGRLYIDWTRRGRPLLFCDIGDRLIRNLSLCVVLCPGFVLTLSEVIGAAQVAEAAPYLIVAATVNIGLSVTDWIYASLLLKTPSHAYIEDLPDGFHVLIQSVQKKQKA